MRRVLLLLVALAACKPDAVQDTAPVALTEEAVGYYCQMNLLEHPGPKAQVHLDGMPGKPLFFSQVRDGIAYTRLPEQSHPILAVWVNDMGAPGATWDDPGATNWIDANTAHYVVGSDQEGGMGASEIVPFADPKAADAFARAHGGSVMNLAAIPDALVIAPAGPESMGGTAAATPEAAAEDPDYLERLRALSKSKGD